MPTKPPADQQRRLRAVAYLRVSLDRQAGAGVERQGQDTRRLAELHDLDLVDTLAENNRSAHSGKRRPEYEKLLGMIERDEVDRVLVWHTDRLHRNTRELLNYLDLCKAHGVITLAVQGNNIDPASSDGVFLATVLGAVAEQESTHKGERVRRAARQARERGKVPPSRWRVFGYSRDGMSIVEDEAAFLRDAARRVIDGQSLRSIAIEANEAGITTSTGGTITTTSLRRWFMNPRLAGLTSVLGEGQDRPREVIGVGNWPAIYPPETYEQLMSIFGNPDRWVNHPGSEPTQLLTSLALCSCGSVLTSAWTAPRGEKGTRYRVYRCKAKIGSVRVPGPHVSRKLDDLDQLVETYMLDYLAALDLNAYLAEAEDDGDRLAGLIDERDRLSGVLDDLEARYLTLRTDRERAQWDRLNRQALDRLDELTAQIGTVAEHTSPAVAKLVGVDDVASWWNAADLHDRRGLIDELVTIQVLPVPKGTRPSIDEYVTITPKRRREA